MVAICNTGLVLTLCDGKMILAFLWNEGFKLSYTLLQSLDVTKKSSACSPLGLEGVIGVATHSGPIGSLDAADSDGIHSPECQRWVKLAGRGSNQIQIVCNSRMVGPRYTPH